MKSENFTSKKNYEHVQTSLKKHFDKKFNIIISWNPSGKFFIIFYLIYFLFIFMKFYFIHIFLEENVCPSSVAAWFHKRKYNVFLCQQVFLQRTEYCLSIPIISNESDHDKFFEWLGVFTICGDLYV